MRVVLDVNVIISAIPAHKVFRMFSPTENHNPLPDIPPSILNELYLATHSR